MKRGSASLIFLGVMSLPVSGSVAAASEPANSESFRQRISGISVPFISNQGQTDRAVVFYAQTFAGTIFVTHKGEIVYSLQGTSGWTLTETLVGGKPHPTGEEPAETQVSYFLGNDPVRWRSGLPTFRRVSLGEMWKGITVSLRAHGNNVEKLLTLAPGASVEIIRLKIEGAERLRIDKRGALVAKTGLGEVFFSPPIAYQEKEGARLPVSASYIIKGREYGFQLGNYDPALPIVIDPLLQTTYLGGRGSDQAWALASHPSTGEIYLAGNATTFSSFPGTTGGAQPFHAGGFLDVVIARLNPSLTVLAQATYLGGGDSDHASALAIHSTSGDVYVAGITSSDNFPGTRGGAQSAFGGTSDAFVARLNANLTVLSQASYLGDTLFDSASALAIHSTNQGIYLAGRTTSAEFPGTTDGAQRSFGGGQDAFVAFFNPSLTALVRSTYLGGGGTEAALSLAPSPPADEIYVGGITSSPDFPKTVGGAQANHGGGLDGFAAILNASLTVIAQASYLGGGGEDWISLLAIHPVNGGIYAAGNTRSSDLPGTQGGTQTTSGGGVDALVARFNRSLTALTQATYLGGSGSDIGDSVAIDTAGGQVYISGRTTSVNFPGTQGGAQGSFGGVSDGFVSRLDPTLTALSQSSYFGGSGEDYANASVIHHQTGELYLSGWTSSPDLPRTSGGAQGASGGSFDAFIARFSPDLAAAPAEPIPTLSEWGLILLSVLLALSGILYLRGRNAG